jgi:hypothetical protein
MKNPKLHFFLFLISLNCFSQNENSKWYFGLQAALDFMSNPPSNLTNSVSISGYGWGSTSVADEAGNLLFFTDGKTVLNKQQLVMANGSVLTSYPVYVQSPLIIKQPGSQNLYYIFTVDTSLKYSIVDMNLAAGMGSVTAKNVLVHHQTSLKISATKHCNGSDVWIISHELGTNNFRSNLVSSAGVNTTGVISSTGTTYTLSNPQFGHMKCSPTGKKIGLAQFKTNAGIFEIFDFNNSSGVVSNPLVLGSNFSSVWSCEFSPDGSKFYGGPLASNILYQWDLCAGSNNAIVASQDTIVNSLTSQLTGMQMASNGKIYISRANSNPQFLGIINNPNAAGISCNFNNNALAISSGTVNYNLPNFVSSSLKSPFTFSSGLSCYSVSFTSSYLPSAAVCTNVADPINSIEWIFGEPSSGAANTSTLISPVHQYSASGTYKVKLAVQSGFCVADTIVQFVTLSPPPPLNLSGNYTICPGISSTLNVSGANSYTWSTGVVSNSISLSPSVTTVYSVTGSFSNTSCTSLKTFTVVRSKCVGISEEDDLENKIKIFPNPFSEEFSIDTKIPISVLIYDQMGMIQDELYLNEGLHVIPTNHFSKGVYILKILSDAGVFHSKLLKAN